MSKVNYDVCRAKIKIVCWVLAAESDKEEKIVAKHFRCGVFVEEGKNISWVNILD